MERFLFMEDIVCNKCGVVNYYRTEFRSGQQCAFCIPCGSFIKNIAYQPARFYVGKLKGTNIADCSDLSYLKWFYENVKTKGNTRKALEYQIQKLGGQF